MWRGLGTIPRRSGEGAKVLSKRDDGSYDAQITVKLGPVKMIYIGTIGVVECDPESREARMVAKGAESRGQGTAQATFKMTVAGTAGAGSHVNVHADVLVTGRVAQMGRGIVEDVARRMIRKMAVNMEAALAGHEPVHSPDSLSAGSLLGSVVAERAKRLFGSG